MQAFDATKNPPAPYNIWFWLACGVSVVGPSVLLIFLSVWQQQISIDQVVFTQQIDTMEGYHDYRSFSCATNIYFDDNLLRKVNTKFESVERIYVPPGLVRVPARYTHPHVGTQYVRQDIVPQLVKMLAKAHQVGIDLRVNSAYRSYERQQEIYQYSTEVLLITRPERAARPGYSEHQLGSAIDISLYPNNARVGYDWLLNNGYDYGFILSYPEGSEDTTGYLHEPWHWRYVGDSISGYVEENDVLFNHQKGLLLPSPFAEGMEVPYEYLGRDLWVWKMREGADLLQSMVAGNEETGVEEELLIIMNMFTDGLISLDTEPSVIEGWLSVGETAHYVDRSGRKWKHTSLVSVENKIGLSALEVLYHESVGYMVIGHDEGAASDRMVAEFTTTCGI